MMPGGRGLTDRVQGAREWISRTVLTGAGLWVLLGLEVVLLAAWALVGAEGWRPGSLAPLALDGLLLFGAAALLFGARRWLSRELDERRLSRHVEAAAGLDPGTVGGSLELARRMPSGVSPSLARLAESGLLLRLPEDPLSLAGRPARAAQTWRRRGLLLGGALALPVMGVLLLSPTRALDAWRGLATPMAVAAQPTLPPIRVEPGDATLLRGEDLNVRVFAEGRDSVEIAWEAAGAVRESGTVSVADGQAVHRFPGVRSPFTYTVTGPSGAMAGPYAVELLDPLILTGLTLSLSFPPHTGMGSTEVVGDPPPLVIPRGTSIRIQGRASRRLSEVFLTGGDREAVRQGFDVDGFGFTGSWVPRSDASLAWDIRDEEGREPEEPPPGLSVELLDDRLPTLRFVLPASDTILPVSRRQPLLLEALDDYGIDGLEMEAWRVGSLGRVGDPVRQAIPGGGARDLLFRPVLDVGGWELAPGDTVRLMAWAVDNRPGGGRSAVAELSLWLPDEAVLRQEAGQEMTEAARRLEALAEAAEALASEARDLERQADAEGRDDPAADPRARAQEGSLDFEQREDLRRTLESEREMMEAVDSLGQALGDLAEDLSQAGLPDAELQRQLKELESILQAIADQETRQRLDSVAASMGEMENSDATRALEDLGERQSQLREQLERALERFQQAATEQELRSVTQEAETLAREEELLATAMEEAENSTAIGEKQEELSQRADDLEERLGALQEQLSRMGDEASGDEVGQARDEARAAGDQMDRSAEMMAAGQRREAASNASQASQQMSDAAERLQRSQQEMAQRQMQALQEAMTRVTNDALALARKQGGLQENMRAATQAELGELRGEQAAILEGLRNMAEQAAVTTREAPDVGQQLSEAIGRAMRSVQGTVEAMERGGRRPGPSPHAASEGAVESLNRIALQAMAGAQALNNPGPGDPSQQMLEQLQQLAEQQGELTNQSESVVPMELSQAAREAQAQQIAEGQEAVAGELGDLAQDQGSQDEALGDLQALAEAAEALAQELEAGRLDATTVQRQEELFHRLLDAGRSLQKDEFAEERRSEGPDAVLRNPVEALGEEELGGAIIPFPDRSELAGLTPAQRALILQYFERLNRGRGAPTGAGASGAGPTGGGP